MGDVVQDFFIVVIVQNTSNIKFFFYLLKKRIQTTKNILPSNTYQMKKNILPKNEFNLWKNSSIRGQSVGTIKWSAFSGKPLPVYRTTKQGLTCDFMGVSWKRSCYSRRSKSKHYAWRGRADLQPGKLGARLDCLL